MKVLTDEGLTKLWYKTLQTIEDHVTDEMQRAKSVEGDIKSELDTHESNFSNPHKVTKAQVGLDKVDNTADADKVVASADKLTTSRKIWGQEFDGTSDVSGDITLDGNIIVPDGAQLIDLGLPSGTLWMDRNVGASSPEDAGLYFAWGETQGYTADEVGKTKQFSWSDYKYANGQDNKLTKYCCSSTYGNDGYTDSLTTLETTDDAVSQNVHKYSMPTKEQIQELIDETTSTWTTQNGVNGSLFTSKTNGNSIFVPVAGSCYYGLMRDVSSCYSLWSSSLNMDYAPNAYYLYFTSAGASLSRSLNRHTGVSVRGVATPAEVPTKTITLPSSSGTLALTSDVEAETARATAKEEELQAAIDSKQDSGNYAQIDPSVVTVDDADDYSDYINTGSFIVNNNKSRLHVGKNIAMYGNGGENVVIDADGIYLGGSLTDTDGAPVQISDKGLFIGNANELPDITLIQNDGITLHDNAGTYGDYYCKYTKDGITHSKDNNANHLFATDGSLYDATNLVKTSDVASKEQLGVVKVGEGLNVDAGVISVAPDYLVDMISYGVEAETARATAKEEELQAAIDSKQDSGDYAVLGSYKANNEHWLYFSSASSDPQITCKSEDGKYTTQIRGGEVNVSDGSCGVGITPNGVRITELSEKDLLSARETTYYVGSESDTTEYTAVAPLGSDNKIPAQYLDSSSSSPAYPYLFFSYGTGGEEYIGQEITVKEGEIISITALDLVNKSPAKFYVRTSDQDFYKRTQFEAYNGNRVYLTGGSYTAVVCSDWNNTVIYKVEQCSEIPSGTDSSMIFNPTASTTA